MKITGLIITFGPEKDELDKDTQVLEFNNGDWILPGGRVYPRVLRIISETQRIVDTFNGRK